MKENNKALLNTHLWKHIKDDAAHLYLYLSPSLSHTPERSSQSSYERRPPREPRDFPAPRGKGGKLSSARLAQLPARERRRDAGRRGASPHRAVSLMATGAEGGGFASTRLLAMAPITGFTSTTKPATKSEANTRLRPVSEAPIFVHQAR